MADIIKIEKDQKIIKVMAAQARGERVDSNVIEESSAIVNELAQDMSPQHQHEIGQLIAFTINELQQNSLNFMETFADVRTVGLGDRPMYRMKTAGIKAFIQATGATTARSYVTDRQFSINTFEIASRPAINIWDIRMNRINMPELIRDANKEFTMLKLLHVEKVLHDAISTYSSPFYGTGTGIVKATLDSQLQYFKRLGNVSLIGDAAAVEGLFALAGAPVNNTSVQYSGGMIDEKNNNGYLGRYNGANVVSMVNAYEDGKTTPILNPDWIYILSAGVGNDQKNLKVLNEGPTYSMTQQTIDDHTFETELTQRFGAAFVVGSIPTLGAYEIG